MEKQKMRHLIERYEDIFIFATRKLNALLAELLEDLTPEQYFTLRHIKRYGPCTSSTLSELNCVNRSAMTAMINKLAAKGYVTRTTDSQDRRIIWLETTQEAEAVLAAGEEEMHTFIASYLTELEAEEVESFIHIYEKIWNIIRAKEEK
ncbi:MarR family winged helix-turn-helix transcriptional regulator [Ectobacillus antri]|jgi:DNA-binding MarR family transcriptional regulator|uniref:MarR family winged helix-turn-helix transcriptional regulator n=1 Tax=Ectobacillus antri TaxID=2486280 RepID=UPI000F5982DE|nr:MarR family transcriptional regulator [Ectobacillus antri]